MHSGLESLVDPDAKLRRIGSGYQVTEGPVWVRSEGALYFHDIPGATVLACSSRYAVQAFRVANAYGLLFHLEATLHSVAAMCDAFPHDLRRGSLSAESLLDDARRRLAGVQRHARAVLEALLAIR